MARPYRPRRWRPAHPDPAACWLLAKSLNISPVTAQVLYNRGLTVPEEARAFLTAGRDQILDPYLLKDMDRAVQTIRDRIASRRPILVYGDYDADGVTGTAILVLALRALGAEVEYYIPNRFSEGYGLNVAALQDLNQKGHDFVLSVDTGVSAVAEAEAARAMGMTLVISDHHEPGPTLPDVAACVNPKRPDCAYPFKGLSGVGVAFKLAMALETPGVWDLLDIVTLGTIADMVPLVGENRAIVREGLSALGATRRPGLRALLEVAGVREPVTATHIGYAIGPRINALGRMGSAAKGVELLLTEDPAHARRLAEHLDTENRSRQEVEAEILQEALRQAEGQRPEEREYVLVLAGEGWHHGVVGICASRVLEAYYRPSILLSIENGLARGSARSIPAFHLHRALTQVSDLFVKFGGHAAAAGMTLRTADDIGQLRARLNELAARWLRPEDLVPELQIDATLTLDQITDALVAELRALEPHGIGNPAPVFAVRDVAVGEARTMGKEGQHLRMVVSGSGSMEAVGWNLATVSPRVGATVHLAGQPEIDTFQGRNRLRLTLKDLQPAGAAKPAPLISVGACLDWDPLTGLRAAAGQSPGGLAAPAARLLDARGPERLAAAMRRLAGVGEPGALEAAPAAEVVVTAELEAAPEQGEPCRLLYLEALAAPAGSRVLVLTASPWAAAGLAAQLQARLPERREDVLDWLPGTPEPAGGALVVAPYGASPAGKYTDTVLFHPPYHDGQIPAGPAVHLLWQEAEWQVGEAALGWPYPDRELLGRLYRLLKAGESEPRQVALTLGEPPGPWTHLRIAAARRIFREIGLADAEGRISPANGVRFDLESSATFRRGLEGRALLARMRASDWPSNTEAL